MLKRVTSQLCILFILFTSLYGCNSSSTQTTEYPITKDGFYFDTYISITIYDTKDDTNINNIFTNSFDICKEYENTTSKKLSSSDTSIINSASSPVTVSENEAKIIEAALSYSVLTNGAFDITINPLVNLWDFKNNTAPPSQNEIENARNMVNFKNIHVENTTIKKDNSLLSIDLGGIAKGYIADRLKEYLINNGVTSAIINLGGNIVTVGKKPQADNWSIGIKKPFTENENIAIVKTSDKSIVTSGIYERYFEYNNKIYHHIIDPSTGYPCDNNLLSVTIISDKSVDGDCLSTSCFVMGLEDGMSLINSLDGIEAIFIDDNYALHLSDGLNLDNDIITLKKDN